MSLDTSYVLGFRFNLAGEITDEEIIQTLINFNNLIRSLELNNQNYGAICSIYTQLEFYINYVASYKKNTRDIKYLEDYWKTTGYYGNINETYKRIFMNIYPVVTGFKLTNSYRFLDYRGRIRKNPNWKSTE